MRLYVFQRDCRSLMLQRRVGLAVKLVKLADSALDYPHVHCVACSRQIAPSLFISLLRRSIPEPSMVQGWKAASSGLCSAGTRESRGFRVHDEIGPGHVAPRELINHQRD